MVNIISYSFLILNIPKGSNKMQQKGYWKDLGTKEIHRYKQNFSIQERYNFFSSKFNYPYEPMLPKSRDKLADHEITESKVIKIPVTSFNVLFITSQCIAGVFKFKFVSFIIGISLRVFSYDKEGKHRRMSFNASLKHKVILCAEKMLIERQEGSSKCQRATLVCGENRNLITGTTKSFKMFINYLHIEKGKIIKYTIIELGLWQQVSKSILKSRRCKVVINISWMTLQCGKVVLQSSIAKTSQQRFSIIKIDKI
ncbi:hypothetical protein C0J52_13680 [Blattella germanica]|nr:hypothetical protein C0J52_13680 [Blattella germanica]